MTIDWWTLGFQTVNVAILIWLLGRFFWKPVAAMIDSRKVAAQKLTDEAKAMRDEATAGLSDVGKTRAGFAKEREAILASAHQDAEVAHDARLAQAEVEAGVWQADAKAGIAKADAAQAAIWADRSSDLAVYIARRLIGRLDGPVVDACFLGWLVDAVKALPDAVRRDAGTDGGSLAATSATELDVAAREKVTLALRAVLGEHADIDFKTDDALIAGFELQGAHLMVRSNWRADLDGIAAGLKIGAAA